MDKEYKKAVQNLILLAYVFISKSHHRDGCTKARENWKECDCGKDLFLKAWSDIKELNENEL